MHLRLMPRALGVLGLIALLAPADAQPAPSIESTIGDQQQIAVTVYNDGQGLIRDVRTVELPAGPFGLAWRDVASGILTQSVSLIGESDPGAFGLLEQNYQYDLIDSYKLIEKYVGKTVEFRLYDYDTGNYTTKSGTLLSPDVAQIDGKIYPGLPGELILPELPGGLISVPTLEFQLLGQHAGPTTVAMSYLTSGMSWQADYVAVMNETDTALDMNGWATISNTSGATYTDATLKLIAGDVNRVAPMDEYAFTRGDAEFPELEEDRNGAFEEKAFFEYHLYTLPRPATLRNNEQKQISLMSAAGVPAKKLFLFDPPGDYWYGQESQQVDIAVKMEFENSEANHMGIPLPQGTVRVYKADSDGTLQFIGEDWIEHTSKDEKVLLLLGNAFDIKGERIVVERRKIDDDTWEYDEKIKLRNHKSTPVTVTVLDHIAFGDWEVTRAQGADPVQRDASTLEFQVKAAPDVETVLTYTLRREY